MPNSSVKTTTTFGVSSGIKRRTHHSVLTLLNLSFLRHQCCCKNDTFTSFFQTSLIFVGEHRWAPHCTPLCRLRCEQKVSFCSPGKFFQASLRFVDKMLELTLLGHRKELCLSGLGFFVTAAVETKQHSLASKSF